MPINANKDNANQETIPKTIGAFLWFFVKKRKWRFLLLFLFPLSIALEQNFFPYFNKIIIDTATQNINNRSEIFSQLHLPLMLMLGFWLFLITCYRASDILEIYTIPKFMAEIRLSASDYVKAHSYSYFSDNFAGSIANKISDLANSSQEILFLIRSTFIPIIFGVMLAVFMMSRVKIEFGVVVLVWLLIHGLLSWYFAIICTNRSHIHTEARSTRQGKIVDMLTNILIVKMFARNNFEQAYLESYQKDEVKKFKKSLWSITIAKSIFEIPSVIMIVVMIYLIISSWQANQITNGDLIYCIQLSLWTMHLVWHGGIMLPKLFESFGVCRQALSLIVNPHEIKDIENAKTLAVSKGEIEFRDVSFYYNEGKKVLDKQSIIIKPKEKIGLVGHSGAGKTTLVNLLLRNYELKGGQILIDGFDIASVSQDSLRESISLIPQDITLFHRNLLENIAYGDITASKEQIIAASKKAFAHEFIETLPEKYDTMVGERGIKLSGGQRQRIAIARAILKNSPILILDEATSSLDSITESQIQQALENLMENKTVIIIAHRLSTMKNVDRLIVFDKGKIVEEGTHQELLSKKGYYAELWKTAYEAERIIV
jgi:ATP-binding cassette subfamily B protein